MVDRPTKALWGIREMMTKIEGTGGGRGGERRRGKKKLVVRLVTAAFSAPQTFLPLQRQSLWPRAVHTLIWNVWFPPLPAPPLPRSAEPDQEAPGGLGGGALQERRGEGRAGEGGGTRLTGLESPLPRRWGPAPAAEEGGRVAPALGRRRWSAVRLQRFAEFSEPPRENMRDPLEAALGISQVDM